MFEERLPEVEVADRVALVKAPLVSVHMITYNHGPYLAEAIEGVVNQETEYPFELLIGEDNSTDNTLEVALAFQRRFPEKIRVFYSSANVGAHANSSRVFRHERGKYVAFCEGDDYWHERSKLQKVVAFLENNAEHVLVHSGFRVQTGQLIEPGVPILNPIPTGRVFERLLEVNFIATCTVCMRRPVAAAYFAAKWRSNGYLMDDYPRWLFASQHGLVGYIDECLATYRCIPGSAMRRTPDASLRMERSAREVKEDFAEYYGCRADRLTAGLARSNRVLLKLAADLGDRTTFLEEYRWYRRHNADWIRNREMLARYFLFKLGLFRAARRFRRYLRVSHSPQPA